MARYKDYSYDQGKFIPIHFDKQIHPGAVEYALSYLIDHELDLSVLEERYKNDDTGAPAYDPAILLKIILFAYSRGIVASRDIAAACRENVIFMAVSADKLFRKRDPRFADADRYRERYRKERAKLEGRSGLFRPQDFTFDKDFKSCICPAGKRLYRNGANVPVGRSVAVKFRGPKSACVPCDIRCKCLQNPDRTKTRNLHVIKGRSPTAPERFIDKMKRKMDSLKGRFLYNKRMGAVEPVFGNMRYCKKLDRFTLRGKPKVNAQWLLFCTVHNLGKIHRYGSGLA